MAQPGVTFWRADDEGGVPHAKTGMPSLLVVGARATPVLHEEQGEMTGRLGQIVGIEGTQQWITGDTEVEAVDQVDEEGLTSDSLEQRIHGAESRGFRLRAVPRP